ncbi:MAG: DNA translocase FtsK [Caldilineaceae bacterium]
MTDSSSTEQDGLTNLFQEVRENFNVEFLGFLFFLAGGIFLFSLVSGRDGGIENLPWLVGMTGWTAPLVALSFLVLGVVCLLGPRAGYWSAEALVAGELLLLSLQAGTFAWHNGTVTWNTVVDGANGGLVGWGIGSLLVAGLGQWPAFVLITLTGILAFSMLLRYTPLVYVVAYLGQTLPGLAQSWNIVRQWRAWDKVALPASVSPKPASQKMALTQTTNFVAAEQMATAEPVDAGPVKQIPEEKAPHRRATAPEPAPRSVDQAPKPKATKNANQPKAANMKLVSPPGAGELPQIDLLNPDTGVYKVADVRALQQLIESTLEDFDVPVRVVHVESGPTVTQFGVEPLFLERGGQRRKVRVSRIVNLADDLALALAAPAVRIEAPVPGRPYVGIEVPNLEKTMVSLRGILESKVLPKEGGKLALPLGRNTAGAPVVMDLTRAPHMLIAGSTGSGKSACINTIVTGLLMQHGPETLRFVMVDPKMVELTGYNGIPHLLGKAITDVEQVMGALTWLLLQMDDRYRLFQQLGVRNIDGYNALASQPRKGAERLAPLPYMVLIIDELADLMMTAAEDIERQICRLAQMARATGIHLILATQRPSVDVVTGLIKANFPTRIAFSVTSQTDSRVILDTPGAERLLGRGDMLLMRSDVAKLFRVQGCFVADDEIGRVAQFWKAHGAAQAAAPPPWAGLLAQMDEEDELLQDAIEVVRGMKACSTSMLQRKLRVGYPKAAHLMDLLETRGIVGPDLGGGQGREVLQNEDEAREQSDEN